jgi:hypothetical protein
MRSRPPHRKISADTPDVMTTATDIRNRLAVLAEERYLAMHSTLAHDEAYMADLYDDIAQTTAAFIGAAVTEIACLRARLGAPLTG